MIETIPPFAVVVDTESYAGNFERQLCAYATGILGACEVGDEEAAQFAQEVPGPNPFEDALRQVPDDHGCCRPVAIWPTPGWYNNGFKEFREGNTEAEAQQYYRNSCLEQAEKNPYADADANQRYKQDWRERAEQPFSRHSAFQSVAIFFGVEPTEEMIVLLKQRSHDFCRQEKIKLTGFRLLELNHQVKESILS